MTLVPWKNNVARRNPLFDFDALQEQINRAFQGSLFPAGEFDRDLAHPSWTPSIDVVEEKDRYDIQADIPGLKKEDIKVSLDGDVLAIQGEKKSETETKKEGVLRTERVFGSFYRALTLPTAADGANIKASYKDGVLTLTVPKKAEAAPKQIDVQID